MAIPIQGYSSIVAEVESTSRALRTTPKGRYTDGSGGSYQLPCISGIMAAGIAGASEVLQFRWLSTTHDAVIRRVNVRSEVLGTAFTAGTITCALWKATGWSAAGTGGGVASLTSLQTKLRNTCQTSQLATTGEIRIATTAALTAGTKTLNTMPIASTITGVQNTAHIPMFTGNDGMLWDMRPGDQEFRLIGTEGFAIIVTVPATGTWTSHIELAWDEVPTGT